MTYNIPGPILDRMRRRMGPAPFPPGPENVATQPGFVGMPRVGSMPEPQEMPPPVRPSMEDATSGGAQALPMRPSPRLSFASVAPEEPSALEQVKQMGMQGAAEVAPTKVDRALAALEGGWRGFMAPRSGEGLGTILRDTRKKTFWRQDDAREKQALDMARAQAAAAAEDTAVDNALKEEQRKSMLDARLSAVEQRKQKAQWEHEDRKAKTEQSLIARVQAVPGSSVHIFDADATIPDGHEALNTELYRPMTMEGKRVFVPTGKVEISDMMASFAKKELGIEVPKYVTSKDLDWLMQLTKAQQMATLEDQKATARLAQLDAAFTHKKEMQDKDLAKRGTLLAIGAATKRAQFEERAGLLDRREVAALEKAKAAADLKIQFDLGNDLAAIETATEGGMPLTPEQKAAKKKVTIDQAKNALLQAHNSYASATARYGLEVPVLQNTVELDSFAERHKAELAAKRTPAQQRQVSGGAPPLATATQISPPFTPPSPALKKATMEQQVEALRQAGGDRTKAMQLLRSKGLE